MKTPIPHPDSFQQTGKQPIILFALSLIFALSMLLPTKSLAQEKEAYIVVNDKKMTYYYNENKPTNALPIENYDEWPEGLRKTITTAEIDQSLENYTTLNSCAYWFYNFENLTEIRNLDYLNTENVEDMRYMFCSCSSLTELDLKSFKTSNVTDMERMFCDCHNLITIDTGDGWKTQGVVNMHGMFQGCNNLNFNLINNLNTSSVQHMSYMFNSCENITKLDLSFLDTKNVLDMQGMFAGCRKLDTIILDSNKFKTDKVKDMGWMFSGCNKLNYIDFSLFNTSSVTQIQYMFTECEGFTVLDLRSFETPSVTDMHGMFKDCVNLTTILVSDDWNLTNLAKDNALYNTPIFENCPNLIGNNGTKYTDPTSQQFNANSDYTQYHQDINYAKVDNGYFTTDSYKIFYDLDGGDWGKEKGVNEFAPTDRDQDINIPNPKREGYIFLGWMVTPVISASIPTKNLSIKTDEVGNRIYSAVWVEPYVVVSKDKSVLTFYGDQNRTSNFQEETTYSINDLNENGFPAWINETDNPYQKVIFDYSFQEFRPTTCEKWFYHCANITKFDEMYYLITDETTNMNSMFAGCKSVIVLPLWSFNTSNVTDMRNMFSDCEKLTTILVSSDKWSTQSILEEYKNSPMFDNCGHIIGDSCTLYSPQHIDCEYARIDCANHNQPGYLTKERCKIFYDLDGGMMPPTKEGYLVGYYYYMNESEEIYNAIKEGFYFLGWTEKFASGISDTKPTKYVYIMPNDIYGNRIFTAHWIEDNDTIVAYYPTDEQEVDIFCDSKQNKNIVIKIKLNENENFTQYNLSIVDLNIHIEGDLSNLSVNNNSEYEIPIELPSNLSAHKYIGTVDFSTATSNNQLHYNIIIQMLYFQNVLLHLYKDVIFVDNSSKLYGGNGTYKWYHNDKEIPNANYQYLYDPNMSGKYKAQMITTDGLTVYTCPIDEGNISKSSPNPVNTYPNPAVANQEFSIEIMDFDPEVSYAIKISNSNGVIVKEIHDATQISTIALPRGVYSGALISGGRKKGFKLIVR
ncbi:MAG: BspA family leucine-rich repeat surface protein [Bacteroidales bacterium]|nr:BspA family leucine-rich repeat surface protein [Bacteroidales bacterium]